MKTLVTGGTGFIGAEIAKRLDARGDRVTAFDLYPNEARLDGAKVEVAQGDLGDAETVDDVVVIARGALRLGATQEDLLAALDVAQELAPDAPIERAREAASKLI